MIDWIHAKFKSLFDIRPGEWLRVGLMFLYFFLVITSYYVIKPVRNSLFVDRLGADNLPYVYIATALFVGVIISIYSRYADRIGRQALILGTFAFLASNLVIFWWLLQTEMWLTSGLFYIWVKLYPLLLVSQFWLVANELFTTPQAKRVFGVVGAGGIVGGIAGSAIAGGLARALGSEGLLLISIGILGLCALIVLVIGRTTKPVRTREVSQQTEETPDPGAWRLLVESSHLRTIAFILGLTIIVGTILDWQLNKAVELFIPGEDAKTAFWGQFFFILNIASLGIQLFLTSYVLRVFGIGVALLLLPLGLLTGSIGILLHPGIWTAAFAKGAEGALRYSLDQSTRELLFLPLTSDIKYRGKPLVDMVVYRGGTGVAGLIVLAGTRLVNFGLQEMAVVASVLIAFWIGVTLVMRREFRASVKRLIPTRDIEPEELIVRHLDPDTRMELYEALDSDEEDEILVALALLEGVEDEEVVRRADRLLNHPSERVRARTLRVLFDAQDRAHLDGVARLLDDPSMDVRIEAIHFVCEFGEMPAGEQMEEFLNRSEDPEVRAAALACLAQHVGGEKLETATSMLTEMARSENGAGAARGRRLAAEAIGTVGAVGDHGRMAEVLAELLQDPDEPVRRAALESAGQVRHPDLVPHLLAHLCCPESRGEARKALASYGSEIFDELVEQMRDPAVPLPVRIAIPAIFYESAGQSAVDALLGTLPEMPPTLRYHILKKLDRMRRNLEGLEFDEEPLERTLRIELQLGYQRSADRLAVGPDAMPLLHDVLKEREAEALERVSRILALLYPLQDIVAAYQGLTADDESLRSAGYELLDSSLSVRHRQLIGPLADPDIMLEDRARRGADLLDEVRLESAASTLERLARDREDLWLGSVARVALQRGPAEPPSEPRAPYHQHELPRVGQAFPQILTESETTMLKLVERADFLRDVDILSEVQTEDLAKFAAITSEREHEEGETLFSEGDGSYEMFLIVSGCVEASRHGETVFLAERGETVGTLAMIDAEPREFTARAVAPTRTLMISRADFLDLLRDDFDLVEGLLAHLTRVVRKLNEELGLEATGG